MQHHGELDAPHIEAHEEEGYGRGRPDSIVGQHDHKESQVPIVAGYGWNESMIHTRHLKGAGQSSAPPGQTHGNDDVKVRFEAMKIGRPWIVANPFEGEAQSCSA